MLLEKIKNFLNPPKSLEDTNSSSVINPSKMVRDLSANDDYLHSGVFFDGTSSLNQSSLFSSKSILYEILTKQKQKIQTYRNLARNADFDDALEEIPNKTKMRIRIR